MKGLFLPLLALPLLADDLAPLSDEFENADTLQNWRDIVEVEGWHAAAHETADIDTTSPGRFHIVPAASTWFANLRGLLFFKEVEGDFIATMRVRVLSRHNPEDPAEVPNRSFSLTGILAHAPRSITQAAPVPYTTSTVWPPGEFGSDYVPDTENYIFLSYGTAGNPGTRQFEIKATRNSNSRLYYDDRGISQSETEAWLQMVRVGDTFVCLRKHSENGDWIVENRYPNANHPLPDFGNTLQVGITAYTDWPTAQPFWQGGIETTFHFNYAPPGDGQPDLISQVDYLRFRRPDPALTESVLQAMSVSFQGEGGQTNVTADPPVLLAASPSAAPYLGDEANTVFLSSTDSDGDGHPDLLEMALGSDSDDPHSHPKITATRQDDFFQLSFHPAIASEVTYVIQSSLDLEEWSTLYTRPGKTGEWSIDPFPFSLEIDNSSGQVTLTGPFSSASRFIRIAVY